MATAIVTFKKCIINLPDYKNDHQRTGSRVFFDLDIDGQRHPNLYVDVTQPVGSGAQTEFLEVTTPQGYAGPLNVHVFRGCVEFYYRHVVGAGGLMFGGMSTAMRFVGYVLEQEMRVQFEVG